MTYQCVTHNITLTQTTNADGHTRRDIRIQGQVPAYCALLHMTEPEAKKIGEEYLHPVTGRMAYSQCNIQKVD